MAGIVPGGTSWRCIDDLQLLSVCKAGIIRRGTPFSLSGLWSALKKSIWGLGNSSDCSSWCGIWNFTE